MRKIIALLALGLLALALPAAAPAKKGKRHHHGHHRATVLKGSFRAVGADGAYTDRNFGKAQLVDNRRRDKLTVHARRLAPRTTYTFALYSVAKGQPRCEAGASGGTREAAFAPKSKRSNARGNFNATRRSRTFRARRRTRSYFVLISQGADPVACAKLGKRSTRGKRKAGKKKARAHGKGRGHGKRG